MYLREVKRRNKEGAEVVYYQLAESVYDKARRQARVRVVHTFGRADEVDAEALRRLSSSLLKACGPAPDPPVETERTYDLGLVHVVGTLWENLGVGPALRRQMAEWKRHKHPFDRILMALTAYRLDDPVSKRGCYEYWLPERVWMPESSAWKLEEFYRAMDFYRENADALEEELLRNHCTHFGSEVDLVFLDLSLLKIVTGEVPTGAASFASPHQNVRSAAVKFWAGIAVSRIGVPIQTWVFPETTPQETALACMEADLRRSGLVRLVCIGEAAEVPGKPGPRSHIRAVPMWGAREVKESVLARPGRYRPMSDSLEVKEVLVNSGGHRRRYILCRNPEEAQRRTQWRAWVL